jgi:hypothetical protein
MPSNILVKSLQAPDHSSERQQHCGSRKHKFGGVTASSYSLRAHSPNSRVQFRGLKSARLVSSGQIFAFPGQFRLLESSPSLYTISAARLPEAPTPYEPFPPSGLPRPGKNSWLLCQFRRRWHDGSQVPQPLAWSVIAALRAQAPCAASGERMFKWLRWCAKRQGALISAVLASRPHPEQGFRILDRVIHHGYRIELAGESLRKRHSTP